MLIRERYLLLNDHLFRAMVDGQTDFVALGRADGTIVYANAAYARHFGSPSDVTGGARLCDHVAVAHRAAVRTSLRTALSSRIAQHSEVFMVASDGTERWVHWTHKALSDGSAFLSHSVGRDVTEHRRLQGKASETQAFLERINRVSGVGGWQFDVRTEMLDWTAETRRIHEVAVDYVPNFAAAMSFYADSDRPRLEAAVRHGLNSGEPWCLELPLITHSGRHIWVRTQGEAEFCGGRVVRLAGAIQEITQRKLLEQEVRKSEAFVRKITDNLPVRIAYVDVDLRYRFANQAHCDRFGRPWAEVIGSTRDELLGRPTPAPISARIEAVLQGQAQRFEYDEALADGLHRIEVQLVPDIDADGRKRGYFYTGLDITDRSRAEQALRAITLEAQRQSDVLRLVTEAIPATVVVIGADGKYRFVNSAFESLCGRPRSQILGRDPSEVLGRDEVARRRPYMERAMRGESVTFTLNNFGPQGDKWLELTCIPLRLNGGAVDGLVGVSQDITHQVRERDRLTALAMRDPLTGLLNRAGFDRSVEAITKSPSESSAGLLYIDLDLFKSVNDLHGHLVGDRLLQRVAERLSNLVRPTDAVARLGGDEFAIVLVDVGSLRNAEKIAAKVVKAMAQPFEIEGVTLSIGASVGVAFDATVCGDSDLIRRADVNLYRAKQSGRGRFCGLDAECPPRREEIDMPLSDLARGQPLTESPLAVWVEPQASFSRTASG